jgi:N-acetylglucosamine kinase-like BadF-type ATPase
MYIFADSGSTKTNWLITDHKGESVGTFQTIGLNPYFVTREKIVQVISENYPTEPDPLIIKKVFFYGSGCGSQDNFSHLRSALEEYFYNAHIDIYSDMLGTARAIFKNEIGLAAIIGTGCNSCIYNGRSISHNAISLGYILGDEGSGAYIGKLFAKLYLEKRLDSDLSDLVLAETGATHSSILQAVYKNPHPNRYLAGFCLFIKKHIEHPQLQEIVKVSFKKFFEKYVLIFPEYKNYKLGFCGSVALNFKTYLDEVALEYEMQNLIYINEPLGELVSYHKANGFE